jgi:predicted transcriptional regulator of viral defense system
MVTDRREMRRRLFAVAAEQGGYFTAAQARAVGYSYQAQAHHVSAGNWHRVDRGVFRLVEWAPQPNDEVFRWLLWSKGQGVVSHESALAVHGLGEFESPRIHLTVPRRFTTTRQSDDAVVLHRSDLPEEDIDTRPGFPVTTVARSLIDVAAAGADEDQLARTIREALEAGRVTLRSLRARAEATDLAGALRIERALAIRDTT